MTTERAPAEVRCNAELGPDERAKLDALLDHIYEYGTTAEGVLRLAAQLCQAARAAERERWTEAGKHANELRQAVRALAALNAWHHFGDCRAWTAGPILSPLEADELARRVIEERGTEHGD